MENKVYLTKIEQYTREPNIAEYLADDKLSELGNGLGAQIEADEFSRAGWVEDYDKWVKLAEQVTKPKSYPWQGASNVSFPLLSLACIQFHARAFAALIPGRELVKVKIVGKATDEKKTRAKRVSTFMSAQFLDLMSDWEEDMDRLLMILPVVGLVYKKIYNSDEPGNVSSEMVSARDVIVNYHARNYKRARMTHVRYQDKNEIYEAVAAGLYRDVPLGDPISKAVEGPRDEGQGLNEAGVVDDTTPYKIYESHCWLDLDGDGYKEPYIVSLDQQNRTILRIVARWEDVSAIKYIDKKIASIEPTVHFTAYKFLPDPESKTHGIGFGRLLGPTSDTVDTLINMLVDCGHMAGLRSGFLSKGIRVKGGVITLRPNEFKSVQYTGDDIHKGIFMLPTKEPSNVLFQLLGLLINVGRDLISVQDIMVGRNPGQNQPYQTTQEVISQGLKVFNGIYKRVYRALDKEFKKVFFLNHYYLTGEIYLDVLDDEAADISDFDLDGFNVYPAAQPDMVQETTNILKAAQLKQHALDGAPVNIQVVTKKVLEADGYTEKEVEEIMTMPDAEPSIDEMRFNLEVEEFKHKQEMDFANLRLDALKIKEQALRDRATAIAKLKKSEQDDMALDIDTDLKVLAEVHRQREGVIKAIEAETNFVMQRHEQKKAAEQQQQAAAQEGQV